MSWIRDIADPRNRRWEEFYRNRWQHDKVVRGTHGATCTAGYVYSPIRVKYPYVRGALMDLWRKARAKHDDPVGAWTSLMEDGESRRGDERGPGQGGCCS